MDKKICVIGAGPSGITAIKNIVEAGFNVKAFDFNSDVGGNWIYDENESHSSVFEQHILLAQNLFLSLKIFILKIMLLITHHTMS